MSLNIERGFIGIADTCEYFIGQIRSQLANQKALSRPVHSIIVFVQMFFFLSFYLIWFALNDFRDTLHLIDVYDSLSLCVYYDLRRLTDKVSTEWCSAFINMCPSQTKWLQFPLFYFGLCTAVDFIHAVPCGFLFNCNLRFFRAKRRSLRDWTPLLQKLRVLYSY